MFLLCLLFLSLVETECFYEFYHTYILINYQTEKHCVQVHHTMISCVSSSSIKYWVRGSGIKNHDRLIKPNKHARLYFSPGFKRVRAPFIYRIACAVNTFHDITAYKSSNDDVLVFNLEILIIFNLLFLGYEKFQNIKLEWRMPVCLLMHPNLVNTKGDILKTVLLIFFS